MHFPNRPTIVTVHDLIPLTHPYLMESWNKVAKLFGSALNQSLKKASVIICVSEFSKQELLKKFDVNPDKLKVIYQPCRFEINNYQLNVSEHPLGVPKEYILYVGAIEPKKNLMSLLRAIEKNSHLPPLVIAGSFAWKSDNERAMIAKLKDRVIHEGYVTEDRLIQLIKHTKAFIFPSLVEGFGLPVLEAMWLNAPCIVSDIPVFHELFKDHVTYIDPYCSDSISDAIEKVIATPVTRDASAWVQKNFSFEKFTREIDAIMQNLQ
jgi:glycosyltransferase involved in cell wall biosynthesis